MKAAHILIIKKPRAARPLRIFRRTRFPIRRVPKAGPQPPRLFTQPLRISRRTRYPMPGAPNANFQPSRLFTQRRALKPNLHPPPAAYETTDAHVLTALTSQVIGISVDVSPMRHLAVLPPLHGILRGDDHDRRQLTIMDALANIAVCEPRGQVVALSLQLDNESQKIHLGVSENDEVPQKVVDHLTKV